MNKSLSPANLFKNNRDWAATKLQQNPNFFADLSTVQNPEYLWIGCSDSRVPANQIVGLIPGEVFVHRNIANQVVHSDLNCLSVIQYAVDVLKVKHIMVVGHYGCGGVKAAMDNGKNGLIDNWLGHIKDVYRMHSKVLETLPQQQKFDRLCELNVIEQVANVCNSTIIQDAWQRGQDINVHGWIYSLNNGLITDLEVSSGLEQWQG
ncbi:carbonate dehydratase [Paraferrimonas sp. SM1919]|uniref:carbonate dehydratase n=1 Tax=Paraferrimonas sp. SM1919 TaxID=2662263 RepID=UPI0013CFD846|nr:carbonate dehydratase [Paraferrimonas sp. SM1919]